MGEAKPTRAFLERTLAAMEGVIDVADRKTNEFDALRSCVIDLTMMLFSAQEAEQPAPSAMQSLTAALKSDPEYAWSWHCNLAMPIMDGAKVSHRIANLTAARLMRHLFDIDTEKHQHFEIAEEPKPSLSDAFNGAEDKNGLAWAVSRWEAEVKNRPLQNTHRRTLDDAWRQVISYFGGNPDSLIGPSHDELLNAALSKARPNTAEGEAAEKVESPQVLTYSIDADRHGIRARVAEAITGALAFGAQGTNPPPPGHWLEPFWNAARVDRSQADSGATECGNCFEGKSDFDHVCKHCGGSGKVADSVLEDAARWQFVRDCHSGRVTFLLHNLRPDQREQYVDAARKQATAKEPSP